MTKGKDRTFSPVPGQISGGTADSAGSSPGIAPHLGATIRKYRKQNRKSQQELADLLQVTRNTVINWENGRSRPDLDTIARISEILGASPEKLLDISAAQQLPAHDRFLLENYHRLSESGRRVIDRMVNALLTEELTAHERFLRDSFGIYALQSTAAAAGTGNPFNDLEATYIFLKKSDASLHADAVVRVSGRSMEPMYNDGDLVYIRYTDHARIGEDVIAGSADGLVIKRVGDSRTLYSVNPDYPYPQKSDDDNVRILGRVLGIVRSSDLPDEEERDSLEIIKQDEIRKFLKTHRSDSETFG